MEIQTVGLATAAATFCGVWFGHVAVRKIESSAANIRPYIIVAAIGGISLLGLSLASSAEGISAALGILGITLLWDAFELVRQQNRVRKGHAPANPDNPRHARILAQCPQATTIGWLDREPANRPSTPEEVPEIEVGGV